MARALMRGVAGGVQSSTLFIRRRGAAETALERGALTDSGGMNVADHGTGCGTDGDLAAVATLALLHDRFGADVATERVFLATEREAPDIEGQFRGVTLRS